MSRLWAGIRALWKGFELQLHKPKHVLTLDINLLPDEVLLKIFSHLSADDLLRIRQVCWRWKDLAENESLWLNSEAYINYENQSFSPSRFETAPALGKLNLQCNDNSECAKLAEVLAAHCPKKVRKLIFSFPKIEQTTFSDILSLFAHNVEEVDLNCFIRGVQPPVISHSMPKLNTLRVQSGFIPCQVVDNPSPRLKTLHIEFYLHEYNSSIPFEMKDQSTQKFLIMLQAQLRSIDIFLVVRSFCNHEEVLALFKNYLQGVLDGGVHELKKLSVKCKVETLVTVNIPQGGPVWYQRRLFRKKSEMFTASHDSNECNICKLFGGFGELKYCSYRFKYVNCMGWFTFLATIDHFSIYEPYRMTHN